MKKRNFKKNLSDRKKDMGESVQKKPYSGKQIISAKTTTIQSNALIYVLVVLNGVIFPQISYDIVPYDQHLLPVRFFPKY